ncbi:MAG: hypothetical protein ACYS8W_16760 [Planctomycetota bacterium]
MAIKYVNISITDLAPKKRLAFPIYAQPRGSDKFILYCKRGKVLTEEMRDKMKRRTNFNYYIDSADIERFRNYLYNIVQSTDKAKKRERVIRRVHEALALEEAFEQERRQPEFGKFPFVWWGLGIVLAAFLCANAGATPASAIIIGAIGGIMMSVILLGLSLAREKNGKGEATAVQTTVACPHCRNKITAPPVTCRFCGKQVMGPEPPKPVAGQPGAGPAAGLGPRLDASIPPLPPRPDTAPPPTPAYPGAPEPGAGARPRPAEPAEHRTTVGPPNGMGLAAGGVAPI